MSSNIDWSQFTRRILISKNKDEVYKAWATPSELTKWFLEKAEYKKADGSARASNEKVEAGDTYEWKWNNWDSIENGVVENIDENQITFTFGNAGKVKVSFEEKNGGTEIILTQYEIPADDESKLNFYTGCSNGWGFWMVNLKAWLEHGIKLNATGLSQSETKNLVNS